MPAWRQTTFYPFALTARHARGDVLRVESDATKYETAAYGDVPVTDVVATRDADTGEVAIFAVNRSQTEPTTLEVALRTFPRMRVVEHLTYGGDAGDLTNNESAPTRAVPHACDVGPARYRRFSATPSSPIVESHQAHTGLGRCGTISNVSNTPPQDQKLRDLAVLRRVRDRMDREYAQPLDVEALARGAHMSAGHLSREFRRAYGESPYGYLMTRRIERAMALLRRGDLTVTEVCFAVGCSSLGDVQHPLHRAGRRPAQRLSS